MSEQTKPYHLMTQAERLAKRISDNRAIEKRAEVTNRNLAVVKRIRQTKSDRSLGHLAASVLVDLGGPEFLKGFIETHPDAARGLGLPLVSFRRTAC